MMLNKLKEIKEGEILGKEEAFLKFGYVHATVIDALDGVSRTAGIIIPIDEENDRIMRSGSNGENFYGYLENDKWDIEDVAFRCVTQGKDPPVVDLCDHDNNVKVFPKAHEK